jgi:hypothetical protein
MPVALPPHPYGALEPTIDELTMRIHHDKHHGGYVAGLNAALDETAWADRVVAAQGVLAGEIARFSGPGSASASLAVRTVRASGRSLAVQTAVPVRLTRWAHDSWSRSGAEHTRR